MTRFPRVTVLVPARDEASHIARCVEHIARQDYPVNFIELFVIDGGSRDGTAEIARQAIVCNGIVDGHVLDNRLGSTPSNLNVGLGKASGEIVCRVDARTFIEPHHISTCVDLLTERPELSVVGGMQVAVAVDSHPVSVGIARALNNRYSMGLSRYRLGRTSGPSDTVYLGAFRTEQLRQVNGWDERLPTNQDFDLNRRMAALGTVWFDARLRSGYVPRPSLRLLFRQYVRFGRAKVRYWRSIGDRPQPRQMALLAAGPVGAAGLVAWAALSARAKVVTAAGGLAAAGAIDHLGSTGPDGRLPARACAVAAMVTTATGWLGGVCYESASRFWRQ